MRAAARATRPEPPDSSQLCELTAPATAASVPLLRHLLTAWLHCLNWPADEAFDLAVAVNEAVTNVIDHAYADRDVNAAVAGPVQVRGAVDWVSLDPQAGGLRWVRVSVRDRGRWRRDVHDRNDSGRPGGRGLVLMYGLMDEVTITRDHPDGGGTEVTLISPSVPSP